MPSWDPQHYLAYAGERGRPFVDLLARVGAETPANVVDLGCGPGNMTRLLAQRWPGADVTGVDSSADMIARARARREQLRSLVNAARQSRGVREIDMTHEDFEARP